MLNSLTLVLLMAAGLVADVMSSLPLWRVAGRPQGPETTIIGMLQKNCWPARRPSIGIRPQRPQTRLESQQGKNHSHFFHHLDKVLHAIRSGVSKTLP
jgi:hypothetical protein